MNGNFVLINNVDKCKVLHIGSNQHYRQYRLGGDFITVSDAEKDLSILIDNKFTFHKQCSTAVNKANKLLGIIRRSFAYINAALSIQIIDTTYHRIW